MLDKTFCFSKIKNEIALLSSFFNLQSTI